MPSGASASSPVPVVLTTVSKTFGWRQTRRAAVEIPASTVAHAAQKNSAVSGYYYPKTLDD